MIQNSKLLEGYKSIKEKSIIGRYITLHCIEPLLNKLKKDKNVSVSEIGRSHLNKPINKIVLGNGELKVLIWTQMHGNESTGTKAIFDILNFLTKEHPFNDYKTLLLNRLTIHIIPILNPDGAEVYTRLNAQKIDLNRDVINKKAPETLILLEQLQKINPKWCFNLHDQRTIFSVGKNNLPATLSFLAPSTNKSRSLTRGRKETMGLIANMYMSIKSVLPNQIGRFTDEFYPTATGDNFQKMGYNTVLIEAGHYNSDYLREKTRKFNFIALLNGLICLAKDKTTNYKEYFKIPRNKKNYVDVLFNNIKINDERKIVYVVFSEELSGNSISYKPVISIVDCTTKFNSDKIINLTYKFDNEKEVISFINKKMVNFLLI